MLALALTSQVELELDECCFLVELARETEVEECEDLERMVHTQTKKDPDGICSLSENSASWTK
jgi:hypothetical protein